jgi:hypothetical protein
MGVMRAQVGGSSEDIRTVRIDRSTRAVTNIPYDHYETHAGKLFYLATYNDALGAAASINIAVTTPDTTQEQHLEIFFSGTGEFLGEFLEGATVSEGSDVTPANKHRRSANTSNVAAKIGVTVADAGTLIERTYLGGGSGSGAHGGADRGTAEWVLDRNTTYLFRLTSQAADNEVQIELIWYEHTPKN